MKTYNSPSTAYAPTHGGYPGQHPADALAKPCACGESLAASDLGGEHGTLLCRAEADALGTSLAATLATLRATLRAGA